MSEGSLCRDREKLASWKTARIQPARGGKDARRFSFESQLTAPKKHAHYWFAVLMDCYLEEYDAHPPPMVRASAQLAAGCPGLTQRELLPSSATKSR